MKYKIWIVVQAVARKFQGIKTFQPDELGGDVNAVSGFPTKIEAEVYLGKVIETVKKGIASGARTKDNLNPDISLDFLIQEAEIDIPIEGMLERNWELPIYDKTL